VNILLKTGSARIKSEFGFFDNLADGVSVWNYFIVIAHSRIYFILNFLFAMGLQELSIFLY
jgi:hypothetical protein